MTDKTKLSTESYKGVRDFYPADMAVQNYIFDTWKKVARDFGYEEYSASILEPAELYKSKGNEEIVNEQTFGFTDRGGRDVVLRPEMTPTLARMVAAQRRSLKFPLRWFSIPNVFRYEKPQRGRKREHWQLNCDIMGIAGVEAEVEIISLAYNIMKSFGAKDEDFEIRINSRQFINAFAKVHNLNQKESYLWQKLVDKIYKISTDDFFRQLCDILGSKERAFSLADSIKNPSSEMLGKASDQFPKANETNDVIKKLQEKGINNVKKDLLLVRGFDYYTGIIFEIYDTSPENNRSLFGGGRYDNLLEIFGVEPVPTVGFGMGDITMRDFLETHNLPMNESR